jgi:hypothetical protein
MASEWPRLFAHHRGTVRTRSARPAKNGLRPASGPRLEAVSTLRLECLSVPLVLPVPASNASPPYPTHLPVLPILPPRDA